MAFRVDLPAYRGPLDLLLYLVRRHELELSTLSLSKLVEQFLAYLEVLQELDVDGVGDFLELASTLVEMKSQAVLPRSDEEDFDAALIEGPQEQLVQRLLEYKRIRDAAAILDERAGQWQQRYGRLADDLPPRPSDPGEQPIADLEVWDLVSAFGRIIREAKGPPPAEVIYDETPIHVHMLALHGKLIREGRVCFSELFNPGMHKSALIGLFLAMLELTRHHGVRAEQSRGGEEIMLVPGPNFQTELRVDEVDNYEARAVDQSNLPVRPR